MGIISEESSDCKAEPTSFLRKSVTVADDFHVLQSTRILDPLTRIIAQLTVGDAGEVITDGFDIVTFTVMAKTKELAVNLFRQNSQKARRLMTVFSNNPMSAVVRLFNGLHNNLIVQYTNNRE